MSLHPEALNASILLASIELDVSIQCRADIDIATVDEYAMSMEDGAIFPPVDLFGTEKKCWIGDGWHRVMAAIAIGLAEIDATLHQGDRLDALKCALAANAIHGRRRTNADKRRSVEVALREFPQKTDLEISEMCGVSDTFVGYMRPTSPTVGHETRIRRNGTEYTVHPAKPGSYFGEDITVMAPEEKPLLLPKPGPPRNGMQFARMAILDLEQIRGNDLEREAAFDHVVAWIGERRGT